jgi:hypothetical protein
MRVERTPLPAARERGYFELLLCRTCGDTEWYAHGLAGVTPSPEWGIALVEAPAKPSHLGPYR